MVAGEGNEVKEMFFLGRGGRLKRRLWHCGGRERVSSSEELLLLEVAGPELGTVQAGAIDSTRSECEGDTPRQQKPGAGVGAQSARVPALPCGRLEQSKATPSCHCHRVCLKHVGSEKILEWHKGRRESLLAPAHRCQPHEYYCQVPLSVRWGWRWPWCSSPPPRWPTQRAVSGPGHRRSCAQQAQASPRRDSR